MTDEVKKERVKQEFIITDSIHTKIKFAKQVLVRNSNIKFSLNPFSSVGYEEFKRTDEQTRPLRYVFLYICPAKSAQ
jgi:hypothetical protein